jgi:hypothetical protein
VLGDEAADDDDGKLTPMDVFFWVSIYWGPERMLELAFLDSAEGREIEQPDGNTVITQDDVLSWVQMYWGNEKVLELAIDGLE